YPTFKDILPLGDDPARHLAKIMVVGQEGFFQNFLKNPEYPPFFHTLVAAATKTLRLDLIVAIKYTGYILVALTFLVIFLVSRKLTKSSWAVLILAVALFASLQPYRAYIDGNYPEILARGIIFPFLILYLAKALSSKENRVFHYFLFALLFLGIFSTHYISFAILILGLILSLPSLDRIKIHFWLLIVLGTFGYIFFAQFIASPIKIIEILRLSSPPLDLWAGILRWPAEVGPPLFYLGVAATVILFLSLVFRPLDSFEQKASYLFLGFLLADLIFYTLVSAEVGTRFLRNTAYTFPYIILLSFIAVLSWPKDWLKRISLGVLAVLVLWAFFNPYFIPDTRYAFGALPNGFSAALRADNNSVARFRKAAAKAPENETLYINNFNEYAPYLTNRPLKLFQLGEPARFILIGPKPIIVKEDFFYSNFSGLTQIMFVATKCPSLPPDAFLLSDLQAKSCEYF
ncbi:hypothetical protein HYW31_02370, partial [Candidatus Berkelbacteria bacterium]|nr:hypothetical protein [Candidatus Berkelbacteria bacterium]